LIKKELLRKSIHFSGLLYIPSYEIFGVEIVSISLVTLVCVFALVEVLRLKKGFLRSVFRDHEQEKVGAYFYSLLVFALITPFFQKEAVFVAVTTAIVGDGFAGISKMLGKARVASVAMFISSLSTVYLLGLLNFFSLFAILAATLVERVKKLGDLMLEDNFTVPIVATIVYSVKYISNV
ncbi:MAG: hypothetical protein QXM15_02400, partial [Archaeoglobaceae archaeon]